MKKSSKRLLELQNEVDKKLLAEGFFDDVKQKMRDNEEDRNVDKAHAEQKEKERQRYNRAITGKAIPPRLSKANLRKYYTMRAMPIPEELEGLEDDHSAYKRSPSDVGRQTKGKAADFIGGALGLDPTQQKGLNAMFSAAGDTASGIAGAAGAAYNYIKGLFGAKKAKEALPQIEKASEEAAKKDGEKTVAKPEDSFTSLSDIGSILAGVPSNKLFHYIYIKDFESYYDKANPAFSNYSIDEATAQHFIDNAVSNIVFGEDRKTMSNAVKKVDWKTIYDNIKKDEINEKAGMGYMSGHYVVTKTVARGRRQYKLTPIADLRAVFPQLDINDLEN